LVKIGAFFFVFFENILAPRYKNGIAPMIKGFESAWAFKLFRLIAISKSVASGTTENTIGIILVPFLTHL